MKQVTYFFSPQRVFSLLLTRKNQRANTVAYKRNFLGIYIDFYKRCIYQIKPLFLNSRNKLLWT